MADPRFRESPFLTGHHQPNRMEVSAPDLFVEGELPDDLAGVFYRNGAEPLYPPTDEDYHWFDGDGMVYAFFIEDGRVAMRSRWVRTEKLELELKHGRRLFGVLDNPATTDPLARGTRYNTANTNIILHGGRLLALMEGAPPVRLEPRTLDTIGEEHYGGVITTTFSAHPTIDYATGELINIGSVPYRPGDEPAIHYEVVGSDGDLLRYEVIPIPHQTLMHTFFVTENHVVFPVTPLDISVQRAMAGGPMVAWDPERPTKLGVMPRTGSAADVRWFEAAPRHMMHQANVWEDNGGRIIADVAAAEGTALFPDVHGNRRSHAETQQSLRRWTIDPSAGTDVVDERIISDHDIQFPRPDDRMMTRASRNVFANSNLHSVDGRADGMDSVLRVDTETGTEDVYHFGDGAAAGELIFAPRIGGRDESDGYAVTLVHRAGAAETELVVFDAGSLADGPLARVRIPFRIPSGFHCNYYSADSPLYRQALG
ncbi:carotenoid oxygenase family protein [Mycobacterium sp. UM_Kg1]|uniref:carotenoid oxygenase family protein n=1 Tax=Mycobacterium sp. UM_Kg1 TaxID=1545691 RepID=UPI000696684C|nr:carotenoid oxygenase family protein [Mycobacterium sp. UM_Kg1]